MKTYTKYSDPASSDNSSNSTLVSPADHQSKFRTISSSIRFTWIIISSVVSSVFLSCLPRKRKTFNGEIVLVTGAAAGIGKEAVLQLAKHSLKAKFVLWDINEKGLIETRDECLQLGVDAVYYVVDLSKYEDVVLAADKVRKEVGQVTVLFNNAGIHEYKEFLDASPHLDEKILLVNLLSYMWTIREFLPGMVERGSGHIINTCSGLGHTRFRYLSAYVASKHGLKGFLDCLKLEMRLHPDKPNIKFSTVYPGWVKTQMTTGITWEPRYKTWKFLHQLESTHVTERIVDGILKEKEEIMVPSSIRFLAYFYGLIPTELMDRMEKYLYRKIRVVESPLVQDKDASVSLVPHALDTVKSVKSEVFISDDLNATNNDKFIT